MKLSDFFEVVAPSKWRKTWCATLVHTAIEADGMDRDTAITGVIERIQRDDANGHQRHYRIATNGAVFCLYWAYDSWCYDIVHQGNYRLPSSCHLACATLSEAIERLEAHVKQYGE